MFIKAAIVLMMSFSASSWAEPTPEQADRNIEFYHLDGNLGLKGYDPVSPFEEAGGVALEGSTEITTVYGGVLYRFANQENKDLFLTNPTKFEPTYGGWCAWARANGAYADIVPTLFTQHGNRMHYFISRRTKALFDRDLLSKEADADASWLSLTGEQPRK